MEINAQIIKGINYKQILQCVLAECSFEDFNINSAKSSCLLSTGQNRFAVSRWVSPKRTRSYPYERVYNTFSFSKRITVIPIVKDEGASGDRDFLQWDTISLMSLLDVYVILAYYERAEKHRTRIGKITNQKFDNEFVKNKIAEISNYNYSSSKWNLKELSKMPFVLRKTKEAFKKIEKETGIILHDEKGLLKNLPEDLEVFKQISRRKAEEAQNREFSTVQPKESLAGISKVKVTISDNSGGKYFWTADDFLLEGRKILLIESKHNNRGKLPTEKDIKDGLLKMMLYSNLKNVKIGDKIFACLPVLRLTSVKIIGKTSSDSEAELQNEFCRANNFNNRQKQFTRDLFAEAMENGFRVVLEKG